MHETLISTVLFCVIVTVIFELLFADPDREGGGIRAAILMGIAIGVGTVAVLWGTRG